MLAPFMQLFGISHIQFQFNSLHIEGFRNTSGVVVVIGYHSVYVYFFADAVENILLTLLPHTVLSEFSRISGNKAEKRLTYPDAYNFIGFVDIGRQLLDTFPHLTVKLRTVSAFFFHKLAIKESGYT